MGRIEVSVTQAGKTIIHTATREEVAEDADVTEVAVTLLIWTLLAMREVESPYVRYK